jgi:hypothetical protein
METLEIIIGIVFVYLLVSLLATILQELWASLTSLRGKMLLKALAKLLEVENNSPLTRGAKEKAFVEFRRKVENSKVYRKYSDRYLGLKQLPSYLSADQVTSIIQEMLEKDKQVAAPPPETGERSIEFVPQATTQPALLQSMEQEDLRKQLMIIHRQSPAVPVPGERSIINGEETAIKEDLVATAKKAFRQQYDEIMDRATDWYKRGIQWSLIVIGLLIAFAFDADTFKIYSNLTSNPSARRELLTLAEDFAENDRATLYLDSAKQIKVMEDTLRAAAYRKLVDEYIIDQIKTVPSPIGLGWDADSRYLIFGFHDQEDTPEVIRKREADATPWLVIQKVFGWIVTALAISLGAPFWFDLLKKLISIRNAGNRPQTAVEKEKDVREEP